VIKVPGRGFPAVSFENSAKPRVGDWVITIGNPFGLGGTATAGIVSAYGRELPRDDDNPNSFVDFLQIDAPINRGNSGGPTFDIYGRVIGVNSAIYSPSQSGGSVGIGFAIPAEIADSITKSLINGGRVARGYLGASIRTLDEEWAEAFGLPKDQKGVYIDSVVAGGPAQTAGVRSGDVVVALNGRPVVTDTELTRSVAATRTGDTLRLSLLRDGRPVAVTVRSGSRPTPSELRAQANPPTPTPTPPRTEEPQGPAVLGMRLGPIDEAARRTYNIGADVRGVVVTQVVPRTDAATKGVEVGWVIARASGRLVNSPADLATAVDEAKRARRDTIVLLFNVEGRNFPGTLKIEG